MRPAGEDLDLSIGWDRFEKLMLAVSRRVLGLRGIKVRRYGVRGQAQHGIDLAGREPDGRYTVIQCKDYQSFIAADLRNAITTFTKGRRPFAAYRFIVATSAATEGTQFADELATLQDAHPDLELDLWGSEQINYYLRYMADVVTRFWTRETAEVFCTGAPLPGVPAPPPDRQEQAERILLGPLNTPDVTPLLREAQSKRAENPGDAAQLYGSLAERLFDAGFRGHSLVLRRRQLDALQEARLVDDAIALAGEFAAAALHHGDRHEARVLACRMQELDQAAEPLSPAVPARRRHIELLQAAVDDTLRPLGSPDRVWKALTSGSEVEPAYQPLLVLLLAEDVLATEPERLPELDALVRQAIDGAAGQDTDNADLVVRLRLVRAEYDQRERQALLKAATRHAVAGAHAALISAREARRCCLEGRAEEALEAWRDAVHDGIHAGFSADAANWLYAIRSLNVQYGPWTTDLDDEHRLAQALRATASGRLLERVRKPSEAARAAFVSGRPIEAVLWARRWLIDSVVTGSWASEMEAVEFLGDLYRNNREPGLAAVFYQRAGRVKKVTELAGEVGDVVLPVGALSDEPWWVLCARAAQASAQADLLDDQTAATLLEQLTDLAARGRAGELIDSPTDALTLHAAQSACELAARARLIERPQFSSCLPLTSPESRIATATDKQHAEACAQIALAHPGLAVIALTRLLDLAHYDVQHAQKILVRDEVLAVLSGRADELPPKSAALPEADRTRLRDRVIELAEQGRYLADVVLSDLDPKYPLVSQHAEQARSRILQRPDPNPTQVSFGTSLVSDAYLTRTLSAEQTRACLDKLMSIATDPREAASNRQDALTAASNLVLEQEPAVKAETFALARGFVTGDHDGSHLDELTGEPHPLSAFKITMGSASLRGPGLRLAHKSATTADEQEWVRDQAMNLLRSSDQHDIHIGASVLAGLPADITRMIDANLLAGHQHSIVQQVSALLSMNEPERYPELLPRLATDHDFRVRRTLAQAVVRDNNPTPTAVRTVLEILTQDPRHSVRSAIPPP
ncbi:hypothetical protein [Actinophytocola sp.]|uniref:hypothetical protein n=1 Tax=Actinophytocola sp. TaxID=1872138 RepID=UPI002DDD6DB6|nr:hypothetical protein [Actinophytocola sp.]